MPGLVQPAASSAQPATVVQLKQAQKESGYRFTSTTLLTDSIFAQFAAAMKGKDQALKVAVLKDLESVASNKVTPDVAPYLLSILKDVVSKVSDMKGKAALVTMAFDTRFAVVLIGSSGEGGAKLHRRNWGEAVENLTGAGEYHWMAGNFLKYGASDAAFGSKDSGDLPVDAHELVALCAPRLTFISYGIPEKGDANWLDQRGSYMATVAAGPAFRLLGAKDLGTSDDFLTEKMPAVNHGLLDGQLAWRQHDGGHTDAPNIDSFIEWVNKLFPR